MRIKKSTFVELGFELWHGAAEMGIFDKYNIKILGTPIQAIIDTEDRRIFSEGITAIGEKLHQV